MPSQSSPSFQSLETKLDTVLQVLQAILDVLENKTSKKSQREKPAVGTLVETLIAKYPDKIWTSELFARVIGNNCTAAAVRKTKQWKAYRTYCQAEKEKHRKRTGIVCDNITEIDEKLDRET